MLGTMASPGCSWEVLCPPDDEASLSSTPLSLGPAFNTRSTTPLSRLPSLCCALYAPSLLPQSFLLGSTYVHSTKTTILRISTCRLWPSSLPSCAKRFHTLKGHIEHCPSTFCIATSVTEDDAKSDPPSLPTVSDPLLLVGSFVPRLWRSLAIFLWKSWTDLCRPFFRNYISASVSFTDLPRRHLYVFLMSLRGLI